MTPGSSPLARGLLEYDALNDYRVRIIPARAGFTTRCLRLPSRPRDHPRSRGVYSPTTAVPGMVAWIIPARAGFTWWRGLWRGRGPDHPRSRGVYRARIPTISSLAGSSPLARGLLGTVLAVQPLTGIIPARAGFTAPCPISVRAPSDHPRSRGVYAWCGKVAVDGVGSSPLARGLRRV